MTAGADDHEPFPGALGRRLGRLHRLAGAVGLGTAASLAGCSSSPDADPQPTDQPGQPPSVTGTAPTEPAATEPTPTPSSPTPSPFTLSTAECREGATELEAELDSVRDAIDRIDAELPLLRRQRDNLEQVAALFEPPPAEVISAAEAVGTAAREAVVFLEFGSGSATGWYIDDHDVITNAHNVFDHHTGTERSATVWTLGGDEYDATTVEYVESLTPDVALLRTDEPAPATLQPGTNPERDSTEPLVQVGHPGGVGNWLVTLGELREFVEFQSADGTRSVELQSSVPGRPGVSGSPVLNLDGEVVGLTYAGSDIAQRVADERPIVADPVVYDRPIASLSWGGHVPIDTVMEHYEEWT